MITKKSIFTEDLNLAIEGIMIVVVRGNTTPESVESLIKGLVKMAWSDGATDGLTLTNPNIAHLCKS
tara:strand:- start:67 stop:267 length:201 start_codon:yes stop_codon:yes gene_type:complete